MTDLLAARAQMGISLAFHIVFAVAGIAMPAMMVLAEYLYFREGNVVYLEIAKRWAKGTAILFAIGAVSGTVLSFELGLLWPKFMEFAGPIIGMPFSLEGFAFFTEAIFLGIYLYGWNRVSASFHIFSGLMVALSGVASAVFVVIANAWMNTPTGFRILNGDVVDVDPIAAMMNPSALWQTVHMVLASYQGIGFIVAGIHAHQIRKGRNNEFHQKAMMIAFFFGAVTAILQPITGDYLARNVARMQPAKLAALEGHFKTEKGAPLKIGGIPNSSKQETPYAIEIPYGLSLLAFHDPHAEVKGLNEFPREDWPNVPAVHLAFQVMVGCGIAMALVSIWGAWLYWRKKLFSDSAWFLRALLFASPLGLIAIEAGWIVTEMGRQPWIIYGVMRTSEAVTPMPGLIVPFVTFLFIYLLLAAVVVWLLIHQVRDVR